MHKWSFKEQIQTSCLCWPLFVPDPTVSEGTMLLSLLGCFFYPYHIRCSFMPGWCLFSLKRRLFGVSGGENTLNLQLLLNYRPLQGWRAEREGRASVPVLISLMGTKDPESTSGLLYIVNWTGMMAWTHSHLWLDLDLFGDLNKPKAPVRLKVRLKTSPATLLWSETLLWINPPPSGLWPAADKLHYIYSHIKL